MDFLLHIGVGGMERMVVFPTLFWVLATGMYLYARQEGSDREPAFRPHPGEEGE